MGQAFPSKRFPHITYEPGEELWLDNLLSDGDRPFYFVISEDLTGNKKAVQIAAEFLDGIDVIVQKVKQEIRSVLKNKAHPRYKLVHNFFEDQREEMDKDSFCAMLGTDNAQQLTDLELLDHLYLKRLGSSVDGALRQQMLVLDFNFNPEYTDELLVVYLDIDGQVLLINHES